MGEKVLDGQLFLKLVQSGAANLRQNAAIVNDLNVFPIPDGDTGENMSRTVFGGLQNVGETHSADLSEVSLALAEGMLLAARGNSGVILSQLCAGLASGFQGVSSADVHTVAMAFRLAVRHAYEAVMKPTEGTMLTVAREATEYAIRNLSDTSTLETFLADFNREVEASLQRTPELLDVLREAGVVDSGGAGLAYLMTGADRALHGEEVVHDAAEQTGSTVCPDLTGVDENSEFALGYCTEFLLQLQSRKTDVKTLDAQDLASKLSEYGDSIVAFRTGTVVKLHIHTKCPGEVLRYCQQFGEFLTLKIENMTLQHSGAMIRNRYVGAAPRASRKRFGVVAVASGQGITETFRSLGADFVLNGGQTQNPSSEDFLRAIREVGAEVVYLLPNGGNILMAAEQAALLCKECDVRVIPTKNIGDGYAVMSMLHFDSGDPDQIEREMNEAMNGVQTGQICRAVRDAVMGGISIACGEYIGFSGKEMLASSKDKVEAALQLLQRMGLSQKEIVIAVYGAAVQEKEKQMLRTGISAKFPHAELCEIEGGQDIYDFLVIIE